MSASNFFARPLWNAGFRPFFTLAFLSGALFPLLWGAVFAGWISLPATAPTPVLWHAHEMFYGFGWAVLGGFLLTASKNWVGVRGIHGGVLAFAVSLWLVERVLVLFAGAMPPVLRVILLNGSVVFISGYVIYTLVKHHKADTFKDNPFFVVLLLVLIVARSLMLEPTTFVLGTTLTVGLFRLAFVIMFERTMTQFMRNAHQVTLIRNPVLDYSIKGLALVTVFAGLMPVKIAAVLLGALGVLLLVRWVLWKPHIGLRSFAIGLMYVGYFGVIVHLGLEVARLTGAFAMLGAVSLHAFTFLVMGIIILGMFIRICQGHTGRKLLFTAGDRYAIGLMGVGAAIRLVATQIWPAYYLVWIGLSAICWGLCFAIVGVRLIPFLFQPRVDGRIH